MTPPPDSPEAPFGDDTDEALNAFLDGELSAFAAEHGMTAADARDRLERWSGFVDRVATLQQARAAVATPVPLDDVTRRRLVRGALPAPSSRRDGRSRTWLTAAAAVVVVLLVVAVGATIVRSGDDGSTDRRSSARAAPEPRQGDLGDVGDVTAPAALRALLDPAGAKAPRGTSEQATGGASNDLAAPSAARAAADADACARQMAGTRPVRFVGRGTYRGRPVVVAGITAGTRTIVLVVPADDCSSILTSLSR